MTPQFPIGLSAGDLVEAGADPEEDVWTGTIRGHVEGIYMAKSAPYARVVISATTTWDVNLSQIRIQEGRRRVVFGWWREEPPLQPPSRGVYVGGCTPVGLPHIHCGYLDIRLGHECAPPDLLHPGCVVLKDAKFSFMCSGEVVWDDDVPLFDMLPAGGFGQPKKPSEVHLELAHENKEPWGWEQAFPLQICRENKKVYACLGKLEDLPDVEDMTDLEDMTA